MSISKRAYTLIYDNYHNVSIRKISIELEKITKISAVNWANFLGNKIEIQLNMIEALINIYPEKALWLCTGKSDDIKQIKNNDSLKPKFDKKGNLIIPAEFLRLK